MRATMVAVLAGVLLVSFAGVAGAQNEEQSGANPTCADWNAGWAIPGVFLSAEDNIIDVDAGTSYEASSDDGTPMIDFYDADGSWINGFAGDSGEVPAEATTGTVCVGLNGAFPAVVSPGATWTYQDGL